MKCPKCSTIHSNDSLCPNCSYIDFNIKHDIDIKSNKQLDMDNLYMDIAIRVSEMSRSTRTKVGTIAVKDNNILSFGWNGTPTGFNNCCEDKNGNTKPETVHSEINTFAKLAKTTGNALGSTLYILHYLHVGIVVK